MLRTFLLFAALAFAPLPAPSQAPATADSPRVEAAQGPVAVPRPTPMAIRYHRSGTVLWAVAFAWSLLLPAGMLFTGFSAKMRDLARRTGRKWFLAVAIYGILFTFITWGVSLPLEYYSGFVRQHEYGLSHQLFSKWRNDQLIGLALGMLAMAATLWIPYLMLRRSPRRWWLYSSLAFVPLLVFVVAVQPVFVDPLFNQFGRVSDPTLERDVLALAERAGIEGGRVYEVKKSVDTDMVNAYVNGLGATKRIVIWDTLPRKLNRAEVLFVMGHEMGHYVLGHMWMLLVLGSLLILVSFYAIHRTAGWVIARFHRRMGFTELSDVASLPLLILIANLAGFVVTPAVYAFTRWAEHEADRYGLELTRDNHAAATSFVKLQTTSLSVPYPDAFYRIWRASHPVLGERIEFANEYRPWETGGAMRYVGE